MGLEGSRGPAACAAGPAVVEAVGLSFRYGRVLAVDGVSVSWARGVHALVGPNGAGKTTLLSMLSGLRPVQSGTLAVGGVSAAGAGGRSKVRAMTGFLPQNPGWSKHVSTARMVRYFGAMRGLKGKTLAAAVEQSLAAVGMSAKAGARLGSLSGGEARRAFIAQALVHSPAVLVLDEPTAGLDPVQRVAIRKLAASLGGDRVVVLSTHLLEDAVSLGAATSVMDRGRIVWTGMPQDLRLASENEPAPDAEGLTVYEAGLIGVLKASRNDHAAQG